MILVELVHKRFAAGYYFYNFRQHRHPHSSTSSLLSWVALVHQTWLRIIRQLVLPTTTTTTTTTVKINKRRLLAQRKFVL